MDKLKNDYFKKGIISPNLTLGTSVSIAAVALLLGAVLSVLLPEFFRYVFIALAILLAAIFSLFFAKRFSKVGRRQFYYAFFSFALGILSVCLYFSSIHCDSLGYDGKTEDVSIVATVCEVRYSNAYSFGATVDIESIDGEDIRRTSAYFDCESALDISVGERFKVVCDIENIYQKGITKSDYFNAAYPLSKGVFLSLSSSGEGYEYIDSPGLGIWGAFKNASLYLSDIFFSQTDKNTASLASALLLGQREQLSAKTVRDLRMLGLSHIIAISGMHLSILTSLCEKTTRKMRLPYKLRSAISILFCLLFIPLTGFSPSVIRCASMKILCDIMRLLKLPLNGRASLLASGAIICVFSPFTLLDIGFSMSFFATLGIVTLSYKIQRAILPKNAEPNLFERILIFFYTSVCQTLSALLFILPISWAIFGELSLISPISNLFYTPLASIILIIAPIVLVCSKIPILSRIASAILSFLCSLFTDSASFIASSADFTVSLRYDFAGFVLLFFGLMLVGSLILSKMYAKRKNLIIAIPFLLSVILFASFYITENEHMKKLTDINYLSGGKNDGFAIIADGKSCLIDVSDGSYTFASTLWDTLDASHSDEISYYVITHYHQRHLSSFNRISDKTFIRLLLLPEPQNESEDSISQAIYDSAVEKGVGVLYYSSKQGTKAAGENLTVNYGGRQYLSRSTHPSVGFKIEFENCSVMYSGGSFFERDGAYSFAQGSDIYIFGGHSPIIKQKIYTDLLGIGASKVICANEYVFSMLDGDIPSVIYPNVDGVVRFNWHNQQ